MPRGRPRKPRADSADVQQKIIDDLGKQIKPPPGVTLRKMDLPHWKRIVDARFEWTEIDLVHAANLARTLTDIEINQTELDKEGYITVGSRKSMVQNPRHKIIVDLTARALSLATKIQVHAAATIGEVENNKKKNAKKQAAIRSAQESDDDLIAKPTYQ